MIPTVITSNTLVALTHKRVPRRLPNLFIQLPCSSRIDVANPLSHRNAFFSRQSTKMRPRACPRYGHQIPAQPACLPYRGTHGAAANAPRGDGNSARKVLSPTRSGAVHARAGGLG